MNSSFLVSDELLAERVQSAARRLAISTSTVRRLIRCGALRTVIIGRSVRVLRQSVDELAERGGVARG